MHISTKNKIKYFGLRRYCPVCKSFVGKFLPVGVQNRPDAMCPVCNSLERHRLIWLYFKNKTRLFKDHLKILHSAPENCFVRRLKKQPNLDYTSIDIDSSLADQKMDLTDLKFPDNSFDVFYCSHVLEHIPDDRKAMSEIYRILKPSGFAIIVVPLRGDNTDEDLTITDPKIREKRYGQSDHVRYYGYDIAKRLEQTGFKTEVVHYDRELSGLRYKYLSLSKEPIFRCEKII